MKKLSRTPSGSDIENHVQDALTQREYDNAFGVSLIPYHTHNGTDSVKIKYSDLDGISDISDAPSSIQFPYIVRFLNPYVTSPPAINKTWDRTVFFTGPTGAAQSEIYTNNFGATRKDAMWFLQSLANTTPTSSFSQISYHNASDQFFIGNIGGSIYAYPDNNTFGETVCTISGFTLGTKCQGTTTDGTSLFMFDNSTSKVVQFSVAGTTLTFVSSSVAIAAGTTNTYLTAVDANYWWFLKVVSGANNRNILKVDRSTGVTSVTKFAPNSDGVMYDPDGNLRIAQQIISASGTATPIGYALLMCSI
jgi:hypothetical protein